MSKLKHDHELEMMESKRALLDMGSKMLMFEDLLTSRISELSEEGEKEDM